MTCAVKHQATLLLDCLGGHEPHIGSCDCLADRFRVSGVVLLSLDVGLNVGRRHQSHGMVKCPELA